MISLNHNRIVKAFIGLMVVSAALHIAILFVNYVVRHDTTPFNFFKIIELDMFFPHFVESIVGSYTSVITVTTLFILAYVYSPVKNS